MEGNGIRWRSMIIEAFLWLVFSLGLLMLLTMFFAPMLKWYDNGP